MAELERLLTWALSAFHAALLVLVLVLLLHNAGGLGGLLGQLSTEVGVLVYLLLWGAAGLVARGTTRGVAFSPAGPVVEGAPRGQERGYLLTQAGFHGGLLGAATVLVAGLALAVANGLIAAPGALLGFALFLAIGSGVGLLAGVVIGVLLALLDALLLVTAQRLLRA